MLNSANTVLTVAAAIGSGLVAGIFFAFSNFVMAALGRVAPEKGVAAMQSINITVINPGFFAAFFGTGLICLVLVALGLFRWSEPGSALILAAGLLYLIGTIGVTMAGNVPLNNALAAVDPATPQAAALWTTYLSDWVFWNHVRTAASLVAAVAFTAALI